MARRLLNRVRAWRRWRDRAAELDAEIAFHLSEEADAQRADGLGDRVDAQHLEHASARPQAGDEVALA